VGKRGPKPNPLPMALEDIEALYERFRNGETLASIGEGCGMSASKVSHMFDRAGVKTRDGSKQHYTAIASQPHHKASRLLAHDARRLENKKPKITRSEFEQLGSQLQGHIIELILKTGERQEAWIEKQIAEWRQTHGFKWAQEQLVDG
jgi:hypothetical protein